MGVVKLLKRQREFGWGAVAQVLSSGTNFALAVLAGRILGPVGLGEITIGFAAYLVALGPHRGLIAEPIAVMTTSEQDPHEDRRLAGSGAVLVLLYSACVTGVMAGVGSLLPGAMGRGLLIFAPWMMPLLLQDLWRTVLFRGGRGSHAVVNESLWAVGMILTLPLALMVRTPWAVTTTWATGAAVAALFGLVQVRPKVEARGVIAWWLKDVWPYGRWLGAASIAFAVGSHGGLLLMGLLVGTADLGGYRATQTVFAPLTFLAPALALPGLPALAREVTAADGTAHRTATWISAAAAFFSVVYLAFAVAVSALSWIFGTEFSEFSSLIWPVGMQQLWIAVALGPQLLLRAQGRSRELFQLHTMYAALILLAIAAGSQAAGVGGAAWGISVAAAAMGIGSILLVAGHHGYSRLNSRRAGER